MALNRLQSAAVLAAVLGGSAWLAEDAGANFADSAGFSGRGGATCIACHTAAPFPLTAPAATAVLEGLPADGGWEAGKTYALTVRVEGGPAALPAPAPQGGFDLAIDGGTLAVPATMAGLLRAPNPQEVTYLPEGTLMREWQVEWTAPDLAERPRAVNVWLAVVAANGNHVIAANASDGGERFDATDAVRQLLPPHPSADEAWRGLPLAAPTASAEVVGDLRTVVSGRHADGNATRVAWRLDSGPWDAKETGSGWALRFDDLAPGEHVVTLRSEGADRVSPEHQVRFDVPGLAVDLPGDLPGDRDTPSVPATFLVLALALAAIAFRSRLHP